jgi:hypothetical protein
MAKFYTRSSNITKICFLLLLLVQVIPTTHATGTATNQTDGTIHVEGVSQQDINGDNLPDVTIIDCSFDSENDRVLVYDQNGDMPTGDHWKQVTNFEDDVWIFDAGADGTAQLIIEFATEAGNQAAYFYIDENQDGNIDYEINGSQVLIKESPYWRMKAVAKGHGYFRTDGSTQIFR